MWSNFLKPSKKTSITLEIPLVNGVRTFSLDQIESSTVYCFQPSSYPDALQTLQEYCNENHHDSSELITTEESQEIFQSMSNQYLLTRNKLDELSLPETLDSERLNHIKTREFAEDLSLKETNYVQFIKTSLTQIKVNFSL